MKKYKSNKSKKALTVKAQNPYFKPVIDVNHNKVFRWLVNKGYTVRYLSIALGVEPWKISNFFRKLDKMTLAQSYTIIHLLKPDYSAKDVIESLYYEELPNIGEGQRGLYESVTLPDTDIQMIRTNFEPKK